MGKLYDTLNDKLTEFIEAQHMFFVGSAPSDGGHINVSPKGTDCFRVLDPTTVAYLDMTGSGVETISHLKDNGRIVFMFCAFEGSPLIVRLHGAGEVVEIDHPEFEALAGHFPDLPGRRAIIRARLTRISDSCGWTVPLYSHAGERDYYQNYVDKKSDADMRASQLAANMKSIDGLDGLSKPSF